MFPNYFQNPNPNPYFFPQFRPQPQPRGGFNFLKNLFTKNNPYPYAQHSPNPFFPSPITHLIIALRLIYIRLFVNSGKN